MSDHDYTTKVCTQCKRELPATPEYFHRVSVENNNLRSSCKACERERSKRWREENPDKVRERGNRWREENPDKVRERGKRYYAENPEKVRERNKRWRKENPEYNKRWREENPDKVREYDKRYRGENPEKRREYNKRYRGENPEKVRAQVHNRRARIANATGSHTAADIRLQVTAQTDRRGRLRCWWCGKMIKGNDYHVDHRIPLVRGGSNAPANLCISCPVCNLSKHAKTPHELGRLF